MKKNRFLLAYRYRKQGIKEKGSSMTKQVVCVKKKGLNTIIKKKKRNDFRRR